MVTKTHRETNQVWMGEMFRVASKSGKNMINKKKFIASFCLEVNVSIRYAKEMLKLFQDRGDIRIHKDMIEVMK